ncbi:MAG TPA: hypothetical protein VF859_04045 [Burkholderiales bacterium]
MARNPEYPKEWSGPDGATVGACPDISGSYRDNGEKYPDSAAHCEFGITGEWDCSLLLSNNLNVNLPWTIIELSQPSADELVVIAVSDDGTDRPSRVLRRGQHFMCDGGKLYVTAKYSTLDEPMGVAGATMYLGAARWGSHSREFAKNREGELVMTVREQVNIFTGIAVIVPLGLHGTTTSYVRWRPMKPAQGVPGDSQ